MSEIPAGATHTLGGFYFKIKGQVWFYYSSKPQRFNWRLSLLQDIYIENNAIPIKQDKEMIYTKEMQEAGELPKVGMKFLDRNNNLSKCISLSAILNQTAWLVTYSYGACFNACLADKSNIHHIDTRTDKEKAKDDLFNAMIGVEVLSNLHAIDELFDLIKAGKIHGVTFTGDK